MNEETFATAAEAAAAWWAQQLGAPVFRMVDDQADAESNRTAFFAESMQSLLASRHPVSSGQGEKFVAALAPKIEEMLGRANWVSLSVDYGPDLELAEAAEVAGISTSRFPWKTHMSITRDYVTASLGYRAPSRLIWQAPDWVRPACGNHHFTGDFEPLDEICPLPRFHDGDCGQWVADPEWCAVCGGSYSGHYGTTRGEWTHSYKPEAVV